MPASLVTPYRAMARNNAWANHRLLGACAGLTQAEFEAPRTGFFPSLKATLNHILIIDWFYVDGLEGGWLGPKAWANREPCATVADLQREQAVVDRRLIGCVRGPHGRVARLQCAGKSGYTRPDRAPRQAAPASVPAPDPSPWPSPCHALRHERDAAATRRVLLCRRGAPSRAGIRGPRLDRGDGVGQRRRRPGIGADPFSADRSPYNRICPLLQRSGLFAGHGAAALTVSRKPVLLG